MRRRQRCGSGGYGGRGRGDSGQRQVWVLLLFAMLGASKSPGRSKGAWRASGTWLLLAAPQPTLLHSRAVQVITLGPHQLSTQHPSSFGKAGIPHACATEWALPGFFPCVAETRRAHLDCVGEFKGRPAPHTLSGHRDRLAGGLLSPAVLLPGRDAQRQQ